MLLGNAELKCPTVALLKICLMLPLQEALTPYPTVTTGKSRNALHVPASP